MNATIYTADDIPVGGWFGQDYFNVNENETKKIRISLSNHSLAIGTYFISLSLGKGNFAEGMIDFDVVMNVAKFSIIGFDSATKVGFATWQKQWGNVLFNVACNIE